MSRKGLRAVLTVLGGVALAAALLTLIGGASTIIGVEDVSPSVDSEMRFYATWYALAGIALLRAARDVEGATLTVRAVGAAFFVAACARLLSLVVVGRPHTFAIALMVVEFLIPLAIVPWQASISRRS